MTLSMLLVQFLVVCPLLSSLAGDVYESGSACISEDIAPEVGHALLQAKYTNKKGSTKQQSLLESTATYGLTGIGDTAPLTEAGYQEVGATCCNKAMLLFAERLASSLSLQVCNMGGLAGLVIWHTCDFTPGAADRRQTFEALKGHILANTPPTKCAFVAKQDECPTKDPSCEAGLYDASKFEACAPLPVRMQTSIAMVATTVTTTAKVTTIAMTTTVTTTTTTTTMMTTTVTTTTTTTVTTTVTTTTVTTTTLPTCATYSCPAKYKANSGQSSSTNLTSENCCRPTCALYSCPSGWMHKPAQISKAPKSFTKNQCCAQTCAIYPCTALHGDSWPNDPDKSALKRTCTKGSTACRSRCCGQQCKVLVSSFCSDKGIDYNGGAWVYDETKADNFFNNGANTPDVPTCCKVA